MKKLLYRRQYVIGTKYIDEFKDWIKLPLDNGLHATIHPDLEYSQSEHEGIKLTLFGFLIDPYNPNMSNKEILNNINNKIKNFNDLLHETYALSGRWVLIFQNKSETKLVNDLIGLREIYYTFLNDDFWCGTDPSILKEVLPLNKSNDEDMLEFANSNYFIEKENTWYGNKTLFKDVYHLMPNHYLDVNSKRAYRYWMDKENDEDIEKVVKESARILKESLKAANKRYNLMLGSTAGLDSRVLIAASKDISDDIFYFVSKMNLSKYHMDIKTPSNLFPKLGLKLNVLNSDEPVRDEIQELLSTNISLSRDNSRNRALQYYLDYLPDKMNVNGVVSEITRNFYGSDHPRDEEVTAQYLMKLIGYNEESIFLENELNTWLDGIKSSHEFKNKLTLIDMFYWEQRMGNWGCLTRNEQDIAVEGFMPYNNRKLIMLMSSVDSELREGPKYTLHKEIIKYLWPETLVEPINKPPIRTRVFRNVSRLIPNKVKKSIKESFKAN